MNQSSKKNLIQATWWISAAVLVLLTGIGYRMASRHLKSVAGIQIKLPIALSAFPMDMDDWIGMDTPIPNNIQRVADNDDFLSRSYTNRLTRDHVNVYVAYSARPRTMLGHRPEKCYVGSGWTLENTESTTILSGSGTTIPCLIHRFRKTVPNIQEIVVLNYYILNGQITSDERNFSGVGWRTPNIAGDPARYVAQVQISSVLENSVRMAAIQMADLILDYFPDKNGHVRAADHSLDASLPVSENNAPPQAIE